MPQGQVVMRIQNSTGNNAVRQSFMQHNATWNQDPPAQVAAGASSANFTLSYNFPDGHGQQADYSMTYRLSDGTQYIASGIIEVVDGAVTVQPSGAATGNGHTTFNVIGQPPQLWVLYTFSAT